MNLLHLLPVLLGICVQEGLGDTMRCNLGNGHKGYCIPGGVCQGPHQTLGDSACTSHRAGYVCCASEFPVPPKYGHAPSPTSTNHHHKVETEHKPADTLSAPIPEVNVPEVNVPEVNVPEVNVPEVSVPEVNVPEVNVPEVIVEASTHQSVSSEEQFRKTAPRCQLDDGSQGWCTTDKKCGLRFGEMKSSDLSCSNHHADWVCCDMWYLDPSSKRTPPPKPKSTKRVPPRCDMEDDSEGWCAPKGSCHSQGTPASNEACSNWMHGWECCKTMSGKK